MAARDRLPPAFDAALQVAIETGDTDPLVAELLNPNVDLSVMPLRSAVAGLLQGGTFRPLSQAQVRQRRVRAEYHRLRGEGHSVDQAREMISHSLRIARETVENDLNRSRNRGGFPAKKLPVSAGHSGGTIGHNVEAQKDQ